MLYCLSSQLSKYQPQAMFLFICALMLLVPVNSDPGPSQTSSPPPGRVSNQDNPAPQREGGESRAKTKDAGTQTDGDKTKVTIEAGHYKVLLDHDILDMITDFFNKLDANEDDVIDTSEMADQWEQLDVDSDGVLSSEEVHGKLTWFELYALDVDGDGIATNREFERACKSLDLDGNGKVELNEFIVMTGLVRNQNMDTHNTYRR